MPKCGVNKSKTNQFIQRNINCYLHTEFTLKSAFQHSKMYHLIRTIAKRELR